MSSQAESGEANDPEPFITVPTFEILESTSSESSSSRKRSVPMEMNESSLSIEEINNSSASNEVMEKSARMPRFVFTVSSYTNIFGFSVHISVHISVFRFIFRFLFSKFALGQIFQVLYLKNAHDLKVKL